MGGGIVSEKLLVGRGGVAIAGDPGVLDIDVVLGEGGEDVFGVGGGRGGEERGDGGGPEKDGVAGEAVVAGFDDGSLGDGEELVEGGWRNSGEVNGGEEDLGVGREEVEAVAEAGEHALGVEGVEGEEGEEGGVGGGDGVMVEAGDDEEGIAEGSEGMGEGGEEGGSAEGEEGLGLAHAAGCATGQDEAGGGWGRVHLRTEALASVAKMPLAMVRHWGLAPRRTAIISAATLTAISSGVMAPISRPMGA